MKCVVCEKDGAIAATRDITHTYKGHKTTIHNVTGVWCGLCDEFTLDATEAQRVSVEMLKFNQKVNTKEGQPVFIAHVRKKLGLDQKAASEIFGGGINAFSRYETGKTEAAPSLLLLLRVLDNHPDLLDEVRNEWAEHAIISRRREARQTSV